MVGLASEDVARTDLIDAFTKAEAAISRHRHGDPNIDPGLVELTERLAIRILVKHHRWVMTGVGEMRRVG